MSDEAALLRAIVESPNDLHLRLVFADWCEEHGHAARAALIRGQCFLEPLLRATHDPDAEFSYSRSLYLSCRQLDPEVARQLLGPLADLMQDPPSDCHIRRGFVESITIVGMTTVRDFLKVARTVLNSHPVQCLRLYEQYGSDSFDPSESYSVSLLQDLVALPGLERVRELDFSGEPIDVGAVRVLLSSKLTPARLRLRHREMPEELQAQLRRRFGVGLSLMDDQDDIPF